ncbi:phenazine biosynthesis [Fusarium albosuccineum]|uniref:Phenazine biosynthesis n=1 Tax=Fusarium albosuccineum TaxID=1237068 RepID=A0A8H4LQN7_9HYPO|nr:phenazine biosynthesis [Fusarium albosuccineum]
MNIPYTILDVFTETPFKGNPLAVVTVPPGVVLEQARKQAIAREFNLSETTFVHDVENPRATNERRFDIFTPQNELPFAGHPTIGTAVFLHDQGVQTLVAKAGPIAIEPAAGGALRAAIPHNVRLHQARLPGLEPASVPTLPAELAQGERGAPLFSIVKGMTFALIELPSTDLLGAVRTGAPELPADLLDDDWAVGWETRRYYFVRLGSEEVGGRTNERIRTRMVKRAMEDPATGSAACALTSYLSLHVLKQQSITFEITQGVEMDRESKILIDVEVGNGSDGERKIESLHLGGTAVVVANGFITA